MKVLIENNRERYERYQPDYVNDLPLELVYVPKGLPLDALEREGAGARALCVDAITRVTAAHMDALPELKLIHSEGVAYNGIDLEAARERGIFVCNNPGINAGAVAEQAIMLMLMLVRSGVTGDRAVREGRQIIVKEAAIVTGNPELSEMTVGLIGFGAIGQAIAKRLAPFGCPVYYDAPHPRPAEVEQACHAARLSRDELLARCDIVCLACAVNDQTLGMVDRDFLARMKPTAWLVNVGRGELVDNQALREAVIAGTIAGMGLDTIAPEPTPADHPLVDLPAGARDRAVYSPHLGGITAGSFRRAHENMWNSIRLLLEGKRPNHVVNGL